MVFVYIVLGIIAGVSSGFLGIGGGTVLIPAFVYFLGMTQHQAQGTTLALMVPPIGLWAAWEYYKHGNVKLSIAVWVCIGFIVGGFLGAYLVQRFPAVFLKRVFGAFLVFVGIYMITGR